MNFYIDDVPCVPDFFVGDNDIKYILGHGLYELEKKGIALQKEIDAQKEIEEPPSPIVEEKSVLVRTNYVPPPADSDEDVISVKAANYDFRLIAGDELIHNPLAAQILKNIELAKQRLAEQQETHYVLSRADSDGDGIPDGKDMCRKQAEVYNGYIDWDGCPDTSTGQIVVTLDADNDGIWNHLDQCPSMQEVYNGFKDDDGCPDNILKNRRPA